MAIVPVNPPWHSPFKEQLDFFKQKLDLPSAQWDDIWNAAHDRALIVTGAQTADLLSDMHQAMTKRMADGKGLAAWTKDFDSIVKERGWTGWTGSDSESGSAWRAKVIYHTNMSTSYSAGRFQQLSDPDLQKILPYRQYKHSEAAMHPRPQHLAWDGLTLPVDHDFWKTHWAPNGWFCGCYIIGVTQAAFMKATAAGRGVAAAPAPGDLAGIDPGFAYAPGANVKTPLMDMIGQKLFNLEAPIGAAMWDKLKPALAKEARGIWAAAVDQVIAGNAGADVVRLAHVLPPKTVAALGERGIELETAAVQLRDADLLAAIQQAAPGGLPVDAWRDLPALLANGMPYLDTASGALAYALPEHGGLLIRLDVQGKNIIDAGPLLPLGELQGAGYVPLPK